jgi:hypothetical protein
MTDTDDPRFRRVLDALILIHKTAAYDPQMRQYEQREVTKFLTMLDAAISPQSAGSVCLDAPSRDRRDAALEIAQLALRKIIDIDWTDTTWLYYADKVRIAANKALFDIEELLK